MMNRARVFIGVAMVFAAVMATASSASAWFEDLRIEPKPEAGHCEAAIEPCGTNLTALELTVGSSVFVCPVEASVLELWAIQKEDELQGIVKAGGHLLLKFSCKGKAKIGGVESGAVLEPGCAVQLHQERGQHTNVLGKADAPCVIKAASGACVVTVPVVKANEQLGNSTLENVELKPKGLKVLLVKSEILGITQTAKGLCGFKESKEGSLKGDFDVNDVSWI